MTEQNRALIPLPGAEVQTLSDTSIEGVVRVLPSQASAILAEWQSALALETKRRHWYDLSLFCMYLGEQDIFVDADTLQNDLEAWRSIPLDAHLLRQYRNWMQKLGYALGSVNGRLSTVKVYCDLLASAEILPASAHAQIRLVKLISKARYRTIDKNREEQGIATRRPDAKKAEWVMLEREQVRVLLLAIGDETIQGRRDALLIRLAWLHALRVGEICALKLESFDPSTGVLTFDRPKTRLYGQRIKLSPLTFELAKRVVADRLAETGLGMAAPLFASYKPRAVGEEPEERSIIPQIATRRVRILAERHLGIDHVSPHDGRHGWATGVLSDPNNSLMDVMQAGGWKTTDKPLEYAKKLSIANANIQQEDL